MMMLGYGIEDSVMSIWDNHQNYVVPLCGVTIRHSWRHCPDNRSYPRDRLHFSSHHHEDTLSFNHLYPEHHHLGHGSYPDRHHEGLLCGPEDRPEEFVLVDSLNIFSNRYLF